MIRRRPAASGLTLKAIAVTEQLNDIGGKTLQAQRDLVAASRYGHFLDERTFRITDYRTPRPWVNVISNPRMGLAVSQTGGGFTWVGNSQLAVITRWEQDLARDRSGKFVYVRDTERGRQWSLSPAPTFPAYDQFACDHTIGATTFRTRYADIEAQWTLFCDSADTVEYWLITLTNRSEDFRRLEVTGLLEWCCGVAPSPRREFHKLFIETWFDAERQAIFARNHMWDVPSEQNGHWNSDFPYTAAFCCSEPVFSAQGDKAAFLGQYGDYSAPRALGEETWKPRFGRHEDAIAALRTVVELRPGASAALVFTLAVDESPDELAGRLSRQTNVENARQAQTDALALWQARFSAGRVETPDRAVDYLSNTWLRYQAISGRLWGRCGYYQQSGAFGFRDQLQDSQIWLTIDPDSCREQIRLHAAHQFADGSVYHWWHPLSEQGLRTQMTDDLLWLAFGAANYIRETGDASVLADEAGYVDSPGTYTVLDHVRRAFLRVFRRTSPRGLPYIGAGDWNDGLSACGLQERGESIWLGHFLAGLLRDWAEILRRWPALSAGSGLEAGDLAQRRERLVHAINEHGWDGKWYYRATLDDGSKIGSQENRCGSIFLNAQTWAILCDVAPPDRAAMCLSAVSARLVSEAGALLLAPAYEQPDPRIGYITRYAPGLRENGGVYTHAATWAIAAACQMRDAALVRDLLNAINPTNKNPDRYWAEPYVLPGNVDGPQSPYHGRGGWTWYTGSAAWLQRVITHYVLGARPTFDGLLIDPCLPADWNEARLSRPWRGATYEITYERASDLPPGRHVEVTLDGVELESNVLDPPKASGARHAVRVRFR